MPSTATETAAAPSPPRPAGPSSHEPPTSRWFPAHVTLEGIGTYCAEVRLLRWNGAAIPRFTRGVMEQIVRDQHAMHQDYAARGRADEAWDLHWQYTTVVIRDHAYPDPETGAAYEEKRVRTDGEGRYHYGGYYLTWELVEEPWPRRERDLAAARCDERIRDARDSAAFSCCEQCAFDAGLRLQAELIDLGIPISRVGEAIAELAHTAPSGT